MAREITPGTIIINSDGERYIYGGPEEMEGMDSISFNFGAGGLPTIKTDPSRIAPAAELPPVDLKHPSITARRDRENRPTSWGGDWRVQVVNLDERPRWHKTKTEGVKAAAHRIAIAAWHAAETDEEN